MFAQIGFLMVSLCLTQAAQDPALTFTSYIQLGSRECGFFECKVVPDGRVSRVIEMSIYNVTAGNSRIKILYVSTLEQGIYIEQCNIHAINGTGSVSGNQGQLAFSLQDTNDCLHGRFECQIKYLTDYNIYGQPSAYGVISVDPVPRDYCSAASAEYRIARLQVNVDDLVAGDIINLLELQDDLALLRSIVKGFTTWLPLIETQFEAYYQSLKQVNCTRGEKTSNPLQLIMLLGEIPVVCDTQTDGGGWLVIQNRSNEVGEFYRPWADYKKGFGSIGGNYWLGLDIIYNLTQLLRYNELLIRVTYGPPYTAQYSYFSIGDEDSNYALNVSGYSGTAGDSLEYHNGQNFSTYDRDTADGCATNYHGAWWYRSYGPLGCIQSNLNGPWGSLYWATVSSNVYNSVMMIRKN